MKVKLKHYLKNNKTNASFLEYRFVDVFFFTEEINLIDACLCIPLSKIICSTVYWYINGDHAVVCVLAEDLEEAIIVGKRLIIQNFSTISAEYLDSNVKTPVLDEYSIIATFITDDTNGLSSWCNNINHELIVKTNSNGNKCVLSKEPIKFTFKIQEEYKRNPFRDILNFELFKI